MVSSQMGHRTKRSEGGVLRAGVKWPELPAFTGNLCSAHMLSKAVSPGPSYLG